MIEETQKQTPCCKRNEKVLLTRFGPSKDSTHRPEGLNSAFKRSNERSSNENPTTSSVKYKC